MKYTIMLYLIIISLFISCKIESAKQNENKKEISRENNVLSNSQCSVVKEWKYGFGFDSDGKIMYYDPTQNEKSEFVITYFTKTDEEVMNVKEEIINAESIRIYDDMINVISSLKKNRGVALGETLRINHKIENCKNWVSKDGKNWEMLEIKYLKETQEKNWLGEPLILVYFKCSYFEGEYYITSRL